MVACFSINTFCDIYIVFLYFKTDAKCCQVTLCVEPVRRGFFLAFFIYRDQYALVFVSIIRYAFLYREIEKSDKQGLF